jgi:hypothetical protein
MKYKLSTVPAIITILVVLFVIYIHKTNFPEKHSNYSISTTREGAISVNMANRWQYKFDYLNGCVQGSFIAKNDHAKLIYSSNIEEGTIIYHLYEGSDSHFVTLPVSSSVDSLTGVFEKGERYEIRAIASKAKGSFDFMME